MDNVLEQIKQVALKYKVEKAVLFGSRARGDHTPVSDYDIAVFGEALSALDKAHFSDAIEEIHTLKKIDVVFVNEALEDGLLKNIKKEGVIIYAQTGNEIV